MKGTAENSSTKYKTMAFYSTDGFGFFIKCRQAPGGIEFAIQTEDGSHDIELSRAEALEVADFIKRGL